MYSGGDSSGDGVNSRNQFNWQITSQTSCNMNSGGSIDWASLAQQWIQMKDSGAGLPEAPPPPTLGTSLKPNKNIKFDEQGEADMEVEREDEMQIVGFAQNTPPPLMNSINPNVWFPLQQDAASYVAPQQNQWTSWPPRVALPPPALHAPITGSLTPPIGKEIIKSTPLQNNVKTSVEVATFLPNKDSLEPPPMDAAKRKILPAWIREGLEKMEREKLKQIEREQKDKHETVVGAGISAADNDINSKIKTMVKSSIMDMEGESSGNEANETAEADDDNEDIDGDAVLTSSTHVPLLEKIQQEIFNSGKTYEERISDMMIAVRKTLTELLLEVTNEEISSIAHEAIRKRRAKASSAQVIRKSAIPSITGKLGLEAYADSDSENNASDTEATNDDSKRSDDDYDSEEELKANIRICKRAFAKTIEEIEERIQASATREEALRREHQKRDRQERETSDSHKNSSSGKTKGFDPEIGEPQPDKKSNSNGKRKKERTSRFSDNKDSKHRMTSTYYQPPSMGSGNLPSPTLLGTNTLMPSVNFLPSKYSNSSNSTVNSISMVAPSLNEKRSSNNNGSTSKSSKLRQTPPPPPPPPLAITSSSSSSSTAKNHRHSESSSSSSSDSTSSDTHSSQSRRSKASSSHKKRSSVDRSKRSKRSYRSSSYRSSRRRDSSDSHDDDHYKKRSSRRHAHKSNQSSSHLRRHGHRRSDTGSSRSRTRSRSRSRSTYSSSRRGDRY